jgi:GT2 family glycosyltransferase
VNAASGHLLLFTDDDVVVDRGWVRAMKRVFGSTGCMGAGGRIVPAWRCDRPEWLATEGRYKITNVIPDFDLGPEQRPLDRAAVGANMGFSKEAFKRYGLFRTDLGRRGNDMMGGEETELFERLFAAGEKAMYVPDAVVNHPVNAYQITIPRVQAWYFGAGRYHAMVEDSPDAAKWFGVPRHLFRKCAAAGLNWTFSIGAQPRAYHRFKTFLFLGSIVQHRELAKEAGAMVPSGNAKCDGNGPPRR